VANTRLAITARIVDPRCRSFDMAVSFPGR
jgi:hypothetical protein